MKPVANFDNFPSFGNAGTRNAPGDAKYSLGFVPADTLPAEWANYFFHGSTKGITDLNSAVRSIWSELENVLTAYGVTPNADSTEQILSVLNKIYPSFTSCSTAASEQTKSIAITGNILKAGNLYVIDMTNANSYGDGTTTYPMLSINSGTAYPICDSCGNHAKAGAWKAGQTVKMLFTGTKFLMAAGVTEILEVGNMNAPTSDAVTQAISSIGASIIGEIKIWAGASAPSASWKFCNGAELSRTEYAELFSVIGVTYGGGDGITTFNLPDMRECVPVGIGHNTTNVFDATETDPNTGSAGTQAHDEYTLGQFKDDQFQGHWHECLQIDGTGSTSHYKPDVTQNFTSAYGAYVRNPKTDNNNGTPRTGSTTHGKQVGVNYIIRVQ